MPVKIGLVAGEASGDQLGGPLITALKQYFPEAIFEGIGGSLMQQQGFNSLFPMERLSVMGFVDPLKRLPELIGIRRQLYRHFSDNNFDLVVGIDAPDFNLGLEKRLRKQGIKTAHYVSPSVWAWRQGRVRKIAKAVDHMLTLFPFEQQFYVEHQIPATFVGHPLADALPMTPDKSGARRQLGLSEQSVVVALMPGSRQSEVAMLGRLFLQAAEWCVAQNPQIQFVLPAASSQRAAQIDDLLNDFPTLSVKLLEGQSHLAMAAADAVVMASGTTTLEAMLLKKPMVVSYRLGSMTYALVRRLLKTPFVSLPNLLAGRAVVKELLQRDATVEAIGGELLGLLADTDRCRQLVEQFGELHRQLKRGASETAARTLSAMVMN